MCGKRAAQRKWVHQQWWVPTAMEAAGRPTGLQVQCLRRKWSAAVVRKIVTAAPSSNPPVCTSRGSELVCRSGPGVVVRFVVGSLSMPADGVGMELR